jgi:hypothetical protein
VVGVVLLFHRSDWKQTPLCAAGVTGTTIATHSSLELRIEGPKSGWRRFLETAKRILPCVPERAFENRNGFRTSFRVPQRLKRQGET